MQLQSLNCSGTKVSDISPLSSLAQLQSLDCSNTQINDIAPLNGLSNLKTLNCAFNQVSDLSPLEGLSNLHWLDCESSQVSELSPLSSLFNLQALNVSNTNVSDLSPLSRLYKLRSLSCYNTLVKKLAPLSKLPNLDYFNVNNCPIEDCPVDIYETGDPVALRAFFTPQKKRKRKRRKAHEPASPPDTRRDVKLILLGNSDAGKTSMLHYLQTGEFLSNRDSTHGLQVHRWLPDPARFPLLADVAVSIWDFGGQEYYHGAYRLFMSANATYLLLWDTATDLNGRRLTRLKTGEAEVPLEHFKLPYWLDTVRHYGGTVTLAPLLAVQNKTDLSGKKRIAQELHEQYDIQDSFHISLMNGCDPTNVRECQTLRQFDAELEHTLIETVDKTPLPPDWLRIRASILELQGEKNGKTNPFQKHLKPDGSVSLKDFEAACAELLGRPLTPDESGHT
ncbi:MAG: leucine-rich repeat domain-containing protein, partial [Bacteroidetes bacterium]|nr:leucine-rich repeat domain-containing protein [Bacteroidota bacterium]